MVVVSVVWSPSLLSRANQGEQQGLQLSFEPPANHAERPVSAHVSQVYLERTHAMAHTQIHTQRPRVGIQPRNPLRGDSASRGVARRVAPFSFFSPAATHVARSGIWFRADVLSQGGDQKLFWQLRKSCWGTPCYQRVCWWRTGMCLMCGEAWSRRNGPC